MLSRTSHGDAACVMIICFHSYIVGVVLLRDLEACLCSFSLLFDLQKDFLSLACPLPDLLSLFSVLVPRFQWIARSIIAAQELRICFMWHLDLPRASGGRECLELARHLPCFQRPHHRSLLRVIVDVQLQDQACLLRGLRCSCPLDRPFQLSVRFDEALTRALNRAAAIEPLFLRIRRLCGLVQQSITVFNFALSRQVCS